MKFIKFIIFLFLSGVVLHASDDDSNCSTRDSQDACARRSPYTLIPVRQISEYSQKYEKQVTGLERRLSTRRLSAVLPISLIEGLEQVGQNYHLPPPAIQVSDLDGAEILPPAVIVEAATFKSNSDDLVRIVSLGRRLSSLYSSVRNRSSDGSRSKEESQAKEKVQVESLIARVDVLRQQYLSGQRLLPTFVPESDAQERLQGKAVIEELDALAQQREVAMQQKRDDEVVPNLEMGFIEFDMNSRKRVKGSLRLEMPVMLSFKCAQAATAATQAGTASAVPQYAELEEENNKLFGDERASSGESSTSDEFDDL